MKHNLSAPKVAILSPPWQFYNRSSIQLGVLKADLKKNKNHGHRNLFSVMFAMLVINSTFWIVHVKAWTLRGVRLSLLSLS